MSKSITFEQFQEKFPSPVTYNFEKPLDLEKVLEAYRSLYADEIDKRIKEFTDLIISGKDVWKNNFEHYLECFEIAISVFWHIAKLHYPISIWWCKDKKQYCVELCLTSFTLNGCLCDTSYSILYEDFYIYLSPTMSDDDRKTAVLLALDSNHQ